MKLPIPYFITLFVVILPFIVTGQGVLQGTITDKKTGESIVGASVYLLGTTTGSSTDIEGKYQIKNLKSGSYTIIISFISYKVDTLRGIRIHKDKSTLLDHALTETTTQLSEVSVTARKKTDTEISILNTSRQSNLIVVGISSQQIAKSQDKDASEVIRRMPGVTIIGGRFVVVRGLIERYNSVWLNNTPTPSSETDQRAFSFDVIPSSMINNMMIYKTPAPEIPADFAGAFIQIQTRNLPEKNFFGVGYSTTFNQGSSLADFYQYQGGKSDWLGFDDGTRDLPSIIPSSSEMKTIQSYNSDPPPPNADAYKQQLVDISRSFSTISTGTRITAPLDNRFTVDFSRLFNAGKARIGNITAINYKLGFNTKDIERNSVESYGTTNTGITYSKLYNDMQYAKSVEIGLLHNWSLAIGRNVFEFCNMLNQTGASVYTVRNGIDHYRDDNKVYKTQLAYYSRTIYSGSLGARHTFRENLTSLNWTLGYSYANMNEPDNRLITYYAVKKPDNTYYPYQLEYSATVNTDANARLFSDVREHNYNLNLNFSNVFEWGSFQPELKVGGLAERKERSFYIRPFGIVWANSLATNTRILYQPIDSVYDPSNFNFTNGVIFKEVFDESYRYDVKNTLLAGYAAVKLPVAKWLNIYGGLRIEQNDMDLSGPNSTGEFITKVNRDTLNLFPSANLTFNLNEKNMIRVAYGHTVNRPEFREIAPFAFYNFQENVVIYGNDSLQSCYVDNFDLRYEWYPTPSEIVTIGAFYKSFVHPIEATWVPSSSGEWDLTYLNAISAYSVGAEIDIRKSFQNLGKRTNFLRYFKNFTVVLNAAIIRSRVETDLGFVRDNNRPMYGQSPFIVNAGLYYQTEKSGISMSLLYNVFGKRIVGIGTPDIPNSYEMPRNVLDFTFLKKFKSGLALKFGLKDILNEEVLVQQVMTSDNLPDAIVKVKAYKPGRGIQIGISYTF